MSSNDAEHRVSILLRLLGPQVSTTVLAKLPSIRQERLQQRLDRLDNEPPSNREVIAVLQEFDRLLRFAAQQNAVDHAATDTTTSGLTRVPEPEFSDDPFQAIQQVSEPRLVATLRDEAPRTVALVLSSLDEDRAARVLEQLPAELRDAVILQLKERLTPSLALLTRLLSATVAKCKTFVEQELAAERISSDARVARLLRTMEPERRGELLQMLEGADPEACERIRGALFSFDDLMRIEDRTMQRLLSELDTRTLSMALSAASDEITERVLGNLSKRARDSLLEEISLLGTVTKAEIEAAEKAVVEVMMELDKTGELMMKT